MAKMTKRQRKTLYLKAAEDAHKYTSVWNACYEISGCDYMDLPELQLVADHEFTYLQPLSVRSMILILAATI